MRKLLIGTLLITLLVGCTQTDDTDYQVETDSQIEVSETWTTEVMLADPELYNEETAVEQPPTTTVETGTTTTFKVTAYCPCEQCCGQYANGITATGTVATAGRTIAVDPTVIPYGSKVILNDVTYVAEDCGGSIKGNKIDMFFDTHQEALEWGVRYIEGVVIK